MQVNTGRWWRRWRRSRWQKLCGICQSRFSFIEYSIFIQNPCFALWLNYQEEVTTGRVKMAERSMDDGGKTPKKLMKNHGNREEKIDASCDMLNWCFDMIDATFSVLVPSSVSVFRGSWRSTRLSLLTHTLFVSGRGLMKNFLHIRSDVRFDLSRQTTGS